MLLHDLGTKALDSCIKAERDAEKEDASNAAKVRSDASESFHRPVCR